MFIELLDYTGTFLTAIATAVATWGGTVFFYRQRKRGLEIENEARQSDEWRKLYLDSQQDSERKDQKIDELRSEIAELRRALNRLDRQVQLNSIYRCEIVGCERRIPPMHHGNDDHIPLPDVLHHSEDDMGRPLPDDDRFDPVRCLFCQQSTDNRQQSTDNRL